MIKACDLKRALLLILMESHIPLITLHNNHPLPVAGTIYKVRYRNVSTQQKVDMTYRSDDALQETFYETKEVQYLYAEGDRYTFMDLESYDQFEQTTDELSELLPFLVEDMEGICALISNGQVLTLRLPDTIDLPNHRVCSFNEGASATARTKPATLTTGLVVQVPEYIEQGEIIRVDTREKKYISRTS